MSQIWCVTLCYKNDASPVWNSNLTGILYLFVKPRSSGSNTSISERVLLKWWFHFPHRLQGKTSCLPLWLEARTYVGPHLTMREKGTWLDDQLQSRTQVFSFHQVYRGPTVLTYTGPASFLCFTSLMATEEAPQPSVLIQEVESRSSHLSLEMETTFSKSVLARKTHFKRYPQSTSCTWHPASPSSTFQKRFQEQELFLISPQLYSRTNAFWYWELLSQMLCRNQGHGNLFYVLLFLKCT